MPNSFCKIWIHAVWSTKLRQPLINPQIEALVYEYMAHEFIQLGCSVRIINGMPDHIHCLFKLNPQKSITDVIKQIKGSSSHFINRNDLISEKFAWQSGFSSFSVSDSVVEKVNRYIQLQKKHHCKIDFEEEHRQFLKISGLLENG